MTLRPDPAKIVVPRRHGEVLIEPPLATLESALVSPPPPDGTNLPAPFDMTLEQARLAARRHLVAAAIEWAGRIGADPPPTGALDRPFVITGHQAEFYHPGVWAKVIAADALARRCRAVAFDLLVDHDTVDHLGFDVPFQNADDDWARRTVEFAPPSALSADSLDAPTPAQFEAWDAALAALPQTQTDTMAYWLAALSSAQHAAATPERYVPWLSRARRRFEASLDLHVFHVPTSLLCSGPLWQQFVTAWIANASAWTAIYNRRLGEYRREQRIKNASRPMPDLAIASEGSTATIELPFWIYAAGTPRQRLILRQTEAGTHILHDGRALDPAMVLGSSTWMIRPRALTLTMFARLFFADLFIHGIGGAIYDQITDRILNDLFHAATPYACVSAAWLLPLGPAADPDDVPALRHHRHHVAHNPQLAIDPFTALKTDVAERIAQRRILIDEIAGSLRTARKNKDEKRRRRSLFKRLHALNAELHAHAPNILRNLDQQLAAATRAAGQNTIVQNREFFLGLHTRASLEKLIGVVRAS